MFKEGFKFYHYEGSLTTPPCTQNVNWVLDVEPMEISQEQFEMLKNAVFETGFCNVSKRFC